MSENTIMENNVRYTVKSGEVSPFSNKECLEDALNNLTNQGYTPVNITQQFVPGIGWLYSLVAKR